jgi:hypothetical protein
MCGPELPPHLLPIDLTEISSPGIEGSGVAPQFLTGQKILQYSIGFDFFQIQIFEDDDTLGFHLFERFL